MQDSQEIEERLSERLLGNEADNDYAENNFRIDGSRQIDISATTIMEGGGDMGTRNGFGGPLQPEYRDAPFALAFVMHLGIIFFFAVTWGFSAFRKVQDESDDPNEYHDYDEEENDSDYKQPSLYVLLLLTLLTCMISIGISGLSLKVMMHHAETLIQVSLLGSCGFMLVISVLLLLYGQFLCAAGFVLGSLINAFYARRVWHRIPFASSNLRTALSAVQTNGGVCAVAYGVAGVAVFWTMIWGLAFLGGSVREGSCEGGTCTGGNAAFALFMVLSFYWTIQVFQNVLHVTVSGVVGTWWFAPHDALSVFSPAIVDSFHRATTYSFGSICMGSLLVSVIQTLETLARSARQNNRGGLLTCIVECILSLLASIAKYFNRWAYCYVGLYGFDYISSGKKAMELFQAKGWTTIITDDLVHRSLRLVAVVVGALSGFLGMLLGMATGWGATFVFVPSFFIGLSMALILMNVVLSAVDTVIVAFAEAPAEFQTHHPALSNNMIQKWRQVFPDECGF